MYLILHLYSVQNTEYSVLCTYIRSIRSCKDDPCTPYFVHRNIIHPLVALSRPVYAFRLDLACLAEAVTQALLVSHTSSLFYFFFFSVLSVLLEIGMIHFYLPDHAAVRPRDTTPTFESAVCQKRQVLKWDVILSTEYSVHFMYLIRTIVLHMAYIPPDLAHGLDCNGCRGRCI